MSEHKQPCVYEPNGWVCTHCGCSPDNHEREVLDAIARHVQRRFETGREIHSHSFYAECCNPECNGQWGANCPHCHRRDHVCPNYHGEEIARIRREAILECIELAEQYRYSHKIESLIHSMGDLDIETRERAELARLKEKYE